jgi:hypothetical protein
MRLQNNLRIMQNQLNIKLLGQGGFLIWRLLLIGIKPSRKGRKFAVDSDKPEIPIFTLFAFF